MRPVKASSLGTAPWNKAGSWSTELGVAIFDLPTYTCRPGSQVRLTDGTNSKPPVPDKAVPQSRAHRAAKHALRLHDQIQSVQPAIQAGSIGERGALDAGQQPVQQSQHGIWLAHHLVQDWRQDLGRHLTSRLQCIRQVPQGSCCDLPHM